MMSSFKFDIKGQLNTIQLGAPKALWPLFEAVINSIQAIEDRGEDIQGEVIIEAHIDEVPEGLFKGERVHQERFNSFTVIDNGIGLNTRNYDSFNTAYSTLKVARGCKGIGRFLWLKAFFRCKY